ncbi:winged helix-turn-helix domain-containing protein [Deinococcus sp. QL22]|nr:winged helix-turn-helix domain-containing protein [Deinococcus sp. QL22]UQN07244.1 winged helix-turn-helix domain-containing protein [Deinococcus sp. QL22]
MREQRFWNAPLLCEALAQQFGVMIRPRALANYLQRLEYS